MVRYLSGALASSPATENDPRAGEDASAPGVVPLGDPSVSAFKSPPSLVNFPA
jgi:hypothetical protein